MGVRQGDHVAFFGNAYEAYWARLAQVKIVAGIPEEDTDKFWEAHEDVKQQVINKLKGRGLKAIIAKKESFRGAGYGWKNIEGSELCIFSLSP
jgi:hypothetical protein